MTQLRDIVCLAERCIVRQKRVANAQSLTLIEERQSCVKQLGAPIDRPVQIERDMADRLETRSFILVGTIHDAFPRTHSASENRTMSPAQSQKPQVASQSPGQ